MQFENGNGFDNTGNGAYINLAYLTWAGITAGKAPSFFSFTGGGAGWANFFSPDQQGFNQPDVLAYTASFGGGFSATLAAQSAGANGRLGGSRRRNEQSTAHARTGTTIYNGMQAARHRRRFEGVAGLGFGAGFGRRASGARVQQRLGTVATKNTWGWAIDAGISFNLPQSARATTSWSPALNRRMATWYSGLSDGMWGENGAINGNGQAMFLAGYGLNNDGRMGEPGRVVGLRFVQLTTSPRSSS